MPRAVPSQPGSKKQLLWVSPHGASGMPLRPAWRRCRNLLLCNDIACRLEPISLLLTTRIHPAEDAYFNRLD
jgi:hypothetical protein